MGIWLIALAAAEVLLVTVHEIAHVLAARRVGAPVLGLGRVGIWGPGVRMDLTGTPAAGQLWIHVAGPAAEALIGCGAGLVFAVGWLPRPWAASVIGLAALNLIVNAIPGWRITDGAHACAVLRAARSSPHTAPTPPDYPRWGDTVMLTAGPLSGQVGEVVTGFRWPPTEAGVAMLAVRFADPIFTVLAPGAAVTVVERHDYPARLTRGAAVVVTAGPFAGITGTVEVQVSRATFVITLPTGLQILCAPEEIGLDALVAPATPGH
jgi:hypothetical protein